MASTQQMAEFLLQSDPPKYPARLAFYNYLKNCWPSETALTAEIIQDFWLRSLALSALEDCEVFSTRIADPSVSPVEKDYWTSFKEQLTQRTLQDLEQFFKARNEIMFQIQFEPHQTQLIHVAQSKDFRMIVENDLEQVKDRGDQVKFVNLDQGILLALWLKHKGGLRVLGYRPFAFIDGFTLKPLPPTTDLKYDYNFELSKYERQLLESTSMTSFYFQLEDQHISGVRCHQTSFQKVDSFEVSQLSQQIDLFYSLKRAEQSYIRPESDPFYLELVSLLEKSYQLISQGESGAKKLAEAALTKGRLAMKNIFPEDRYLLSLITNIEYWLVKLEQKTNKEDYDQTKFEKNL